MARESAFQLIFDWDPAKAVTNRAKHGVTFEAAMRAIIDPLSISLLDQVSDPTEARWVTVGMAEGALLVVVHTHVEMDGDRAYIRIISARRATPRERRQYESGLS